MTASNWIGLQFKILGKEISLKIFSTNQVIFPKDESITNITASLLG